MPQSDNHACSVTWLEAGQTRRARWRSERGCAAPRRVELVDDTTSADSAYKLACAGTALLWRGDFQNAKLLLKSLARRIDRVPKRKQKKVAQTLAMVDVFHLHRLAQSQRARLLGMLLIESNPDYSISLRRAPDFKTACAEAWGEAEPDGSSSVVSLRELLGVNSAHEWRCVGVEIEALRASAHQRIYPHYGVFSPVRGEYLKLVADGLLPKPPKGHNDIVAFDIGTGTGVLSAILAQRGVGHIVATDNDSRALACARSNLAQLMQAHQVSVLEAHLFPPGLASLIVCNPPWLPARPGSPLERAIYDEGSQMLNGFLSGLKSHLAPGGEGWLILSNLAEHLGLRTHQYLLDAFERNGLKVVGRSDTKPTHPKVDDSSDALHTARAKEVTSLWRLAVAVEPQAALAPTKAL